MLINWRSVTGELRPLLNAGSVKNKEERIMVTKAQKSQIIAEYGRGEGDTGSPEVQIAILTARINILLL